MQQVIFFRMNAEPCSCFCSHYYRCTPCPVSCSQGLRGSTGFTGVEVFRKYLWYVLRLRKFDHDAVEDLLALKVQAGSSSSHAQHTGTLSCTSSEPFNQHSSTHQVSCRVQLVCSRGCTQPCAAKWCLYLMSALVNTL